MASIQAIGLGCRRSASSFLHDCLNHHPEINKPQRGLHFFSEHYERGISWYEMQVAESEHTDHLNMEFSVSYMYPGYAGIVAERVHAYNPQAKLFATLRSPVDRAFSDFLRSQRNAEIPSGMSFERALKVYPGFIDRGRYASLLQPFIDLNEARNMHILLYDDLQNSIEAYLLPLLSFLGVSTLAPEISSEKPAEAGRAVSNQKLQEALMLGKQAVDDLAQKLRLGSRWEQAKGILRGPYKWVRARNTKEVQMEASTRKWLVDEYLDDIAWVEYFTGRDLALWRL